MRIFAAIMTQEEKTLLEERIVDVLKTVYDPEIPVNIYDLGMIYKIDVQDDSSVELDMTFTAPNCPAADYILEDVRTKVESVEGVKGANVNLVFEPAWDQSMSWVARHPPRKDAGAKTGTLSRLDQGESRSHLPVGRYVRLLV